MKASILYYTNNILSHKLFEKNLTMIIDHAEKNNCELVMVSQYPIIKEHDVVNLEYATRTQKTKPSQQWINTYVDYVHYDKIKNIVVGEIDCLCESIILQMLCGLDYVNTDKVIPMEDDCFYPKGYVPAVIETLENHNCSYALNNRVFLDSMGFWKANMNIFYMSCFAFRKDIAKDFLNKRRQTIIKRMFHDFEPVMDKQEIDDTVCIDELFEGEVMDVQHGLNQTGIKLGEKHLDYHPYWGKASDYISLFKDVTISNETKKYVYGLSVL